MPDQYQRLAELIHTNTDTVFFGGAGVSTESGIPDFRSASGLYAAQQAYGYPPEELLSRDMLIRHPELFFRYYRDNLIAREAKPNAAHLALAQLEEMKLLRAVVTQNIDGLHQAAGSANVYELHGSNHRHYCVVCGLRYTLDETLDAAHISGDIPRCWDCGGMVRPDVVLYGENLDGDVLSGAANVIDGARLLIVGGTSLAVHPAAGLLRYFRGDELVLINKSSTPYDAMAGLVVNNPIGEVFAAVMGMLG